MRRLIPLVSAIVLAFNASAAWAASYTVREGDTLSRIAQSQLGGPVYGANGSLSRLAALNPEAMSRPAALKPGQTIDLPDDGTLTHVVRRGETLSSIAHRYYKGRVYGLDGTIRILLGLNPELSERGRDFHKLSPGQVLVIRGGQDSYAESVARAPVEWKHGLKKDLKKATAVAVTRKNMSRPKASRQVASIETLGPIRVQVPVEVPARSKVARAPKVARALPEERPWVAPTRPDVPAARLVEPGSVDRMPAQVRDEERPAVNPAGEREALRHLSDGQSLYKGAKYREALEHFRASRQLNPEPVASWIYEIKTLHLLKRDDEARALAMGLVKERPHLRRLRAISTLIGE